MIPRRLSLTDHEKELFERARRGLVASPEAREHLRERLRASVATQGSTPGPRLEALPRANARVEPLTLTPKLPVAKVLLGVVGAMAIAGAIARLASGRRAPRGSSTQLLDQSVGGGPREAIPPSAPVPSAMPSEIAPAPPAPIPRLHSGMRLQSGSVPVARAPSDAIPDGLPAGHDPSPRADPSDSIAIEAELLERARTALREGELDWAEADLEEHRARFPSGSLAEERESLRVESALRARGPEAAASLLRDFEARYPRSFFLPVLEREVRGSQPVPPKGVRP